MRIERITNWQLLMLLSGSLIGTSTIIMPTSLAGRSGWLTIMLAVIPALISLSVWWQLSLTWKKPLVQGLLDQLGPILGATLALGYLFYFLLLGALVTTNINFLSTIAVLPETPKLVFASGLLLLSALAIRGGLESIGRLAEIILPLIGFAILVGIILLIATPNLVSWDYLLPLLDEGWVQTLRATLSVFSFPFGETIIFTSLLPFAMDLKKARKQSLLVIISIGIVLGWISLLETAVLGEEVTRIAFPGLSLLREIRVADFISRLEVLGIFVWTFASFIKLSFCFWALASGLAQLLKLPDYRPLIFPLGIIIAILSVTLFETFHDQSTFATLIYPLYVFPFQFIIPLFLLILARLKPTKP